VRLAASLGWRHARGLCIVLTLVQAPNDLEVAAEAAPTASSTSRRNVRAAIASVVLVGAFVWILGRGGFPLLPPAGWTASVSVAPFLGFCGLLLLSMLTKYGRCHFLIAPLAKVPFRRLMTINAIGMALVTFLPLRIGEMARPAMLREKGSLSAWAVTGTVGAERILDGLAFSVLLLVGLGLAVPHSPLPDHIGSLPVPVSLVPRMARFAALLFAAAFVAMAAFYWLRATARRITEAVVGIASKKLATRLADIVERLSDGLRFLTNWRYSVPYLVVTLISVMSHAWAMWLLAQATGLEELTFAQSMVVLGVLALGFSAPNAPGFFGVVQLALYAGLATYIAPEKVAREGAIYVFLCYVVYLLVVSLLALLSVVVEFFASSTSTLRSSSGAA
jgi:glycosyltransferase 2 family protein